MLERIAQRAGNCLIIERSLSRNHSYVYRRRAPSFTARQSTGQARRTTVSLSDTKLQLMVTQLNSTQLNEQLRTQVTNTSMSASIQSLLHNRLQYANIVNWSIADSGQVSRKIVFDNLVLCVTRNTQRLQCNEFHTRYTYCVRSLGRREISIRNIGRSLEFSRRPNSWFPPSRNVG